jgi:hypothetical protein
LPYAETRADEIAPDPSRRTAEKVLRSYFRAKDGNRPHLMRGPRALAVTGKIMSRARADAVERDFLRGGARR